MADTDPEGHIIPDGTPLERVIRDPRHRNEWSDPKRVRDLLKPRPFDDAPRAITRAREPRSGRAPCGYSWGRLIA